MHFKEKSSTSEKQHWDEYSNEKAIPIPYSNGKRKRITSPVPRECCKKDSRNARSHRKSFSQELFSPNFPKLIV